jgi:hypothetical protein
VLGVKPFVIVALTVTVPAAVVFSVLPVIVAPVVPAFWTLHIIGAWFVASDGTTVPVRVRGVPAVAVVGTPVILVTAVNGMLNASIVMLVSALALKLAVAAKRTKYVPGTRFVIVGPITGV